MNRASRLLACVLLTGAILLSGAGTTLAAPSVYTQVLRAYERSGSVPPCRFTSGQLAKALQGVDTYGAQYFQDFTDAIQAALTARAGGTCLSASARSAARTGAASTASTSSPSLRLRPLTAATGGGVPAPLVILAILAALTALLAAAVSVFRWGAWKPAPLAAWQHSWREAGGRLQTAWAEFGDWLRSGS